MLPIALPRPQLTYPKDVPKDSLSIGSIWTLNSGMGGRGSKVGPKLYVQHRS